MTTSGRSGIDVVSLQRAVNKLLEVLTLISIIITMHALHRLSPVTLLPCLFVYGVQTASDWRMIVCFRVRCVGWFFSVL